MAHITIQRFQAAVLFARGAAPRTLGPGEHRYRGRRSQITVVDLRPTELRVPAQDVLTSEGVGVRVGVVLRFRVADPLTFVESAAADAPMAWEHGAVAAQDRLRLALQLGVRHAVARRTVEEVIASRDELAQEVLATMAGEAEATGVVCERVAVRDVVPPGEVRQAFTAVVTARQHARAALERARGEQAALRSLANAARLVESTPALLELRALQAAEQPGTTLVLGRDGRA